MASCTDDPVIIHIKAGVLAEDIAKGYVPWDFPEVARARMETSGALKGRYKVSFMGKPYFFKRSDLRCKPQSVYKGKRD